MTFLKHMYISASYEIRILLRSWFFRIFATAALIGITITMILFYSTVAPVPAYMRGLNSMMPYYTVFLLNLVSMVLAIFLATDISKRDRKFNSSTVIFVRNISNTALVLGRAAGLLTLFVVLELAALLITLLINGPFSDLDIHLFAYFFYLFVLSLPTLIFTIGMAFFLMQVIPNQAVVVILVLGVLAGTGFYIHDVQFQLFDVAAIRFPFILSDFVGLGRPETILLQRLVWFLCGLWLLLLSVLLFRRLPQAPRARIVMLLLAVLLPLAVLYGGWSYVNWFRTGVEQRAQLKEQLRLLDTKPNFTLESAKLDVKHSGDNISVKALLSLSNMTPATLDTFYLLLNPGLAVKEFPPQLEYTRAGALLKITRSDQKSWAGGAKQEVELTYRGSPDGRIVYPYVKESERVYNTHLWFFRMPRIPVFAQANYLLLTAPALWYPQAQSPYLRQTLLWPIDFDLEVQTFPELTVVTAGQADSLGQGHFRFNEMPPMKSLQLVAGPYVKNEIETKRGSVALYHHPRHDRYLGHFDLIGDTLAPVVNELFDDLETDLQLNYPYQRFDLVEIPLMFYDYPRHGLTSPDMRHPEQVWIAENGASMPATYFKYREERQQRRGRWTNETLTDKEKQIDLFKRVALPTFAGERLWMGDEELTGYRPDLNIWPMFFNMVVTLTGDSRQLAAAFESYLQTEAVEDEPTNRWWRGGLTSAEEANLALQEKKLQEWQTSRSEIAEKVQKHVGTYLIKSLQNALGDEPFRELVQKLATEKRFEPVSSDSLTELVLKQTGFNLAEEMKRLQTQQDLPGFLFAGFKVYPVKDNERVRQQLLFDVYNPTSSPGLIEVYLRINTGGRGRWRGGDGGDEQPSRLYRVEAGEALRIGWISDDVVAGVKIKSLLSQNLPEEYDITLQSDEDARPSSNMFEGYKPINWLEQRREDEGIVIDNANETFKYTIMQHQSPLKRWIHGDPEDDPNDFDYFRWWYGPSQWSRLKFPTFYGRFVHSAHYTRSGSGERDVSWAADLPESGWYQVYVHVPDMEQLMGRRRNRKLLENQSYEVVHANGSSTIEMDLSDARPGWNYLETFYFEAGDARMSLSNESSGSLVIADAVKWVPKE